MLKNFYKTILMLSCLFLATSCGPQSQTSTTKLTSLEDSGFSPNARGVYDAIANEVGPTPEQKNAVMIEVARSMAIQLRIARNRQIRSTVIGNGAHAGWADKIIAAVDSVKPNVQARPEITKFKDSGFSPNEREVYDAIANEIRATPEQKNAVMVRVKAAMAKMPKEQLIRGAAISEAVKNNGNYPLWGLQIKIAVDKADPITFSHKSSRLPLAVYNAVVDRIEASAAQKNAVIIGLRNALASRPKDQAVRDGDIRIAVRNNGNYPGWAEDIKAAVDVADPIPVEEALLSLEESGLDQRIYEVIRNIRLANNDQKNALIRAILPILNMDSALESGRAIVQAVDEHAPLAGFDLKRWLIDVIDAVHPIVVLVTPFEESGLERDIYDLLVGQEINNTQKNRDIMLLAPLAKNQFLSKEARENSIRTVFHDKPEDFLNRLIELVNEKYPK